MDDAQAAAQLLPDSAEVTELQLRLTSLNGSAAEQPAAAEEAESGYGKLLQVAKVPGEGRALITKAAVQPGQQLMTDRPFALLLSLELHDMLCFFCFARLGEVCYYCKRCSVPRYCSLRCRQRDTCHMAATCGVPWGKAVMPFFILPALIAARLKQGAPGSEQVAALPKHMSLGRLQCLAGGKRIVHACLLSAIWNTCLATYRGPTDCPQLSAQDILEAQFIYLTNGVSITIPSFMGLDAILSHETPDADFGFQSFGGFAGFALYPHTSLINQGCLPNVAGWFNGTKYVVRAVQPLQKAQVLRISYGVQVGVHNSLIRKRYLRDRYLINCTCRWCEGDAEEWDLKIAGWQCAQCTAPVITFHALDKHEDIADWHMRCLRCAHKETPAGQGKRQKQLDLAAAEPERVHNSSPRIPFMQSSRAEGQALAAAYSRQLQVQGRILQPTHADIAMTHLNLSIACDESGDGDLAATHRLEAVRIMKAACPGKSALAAKAALLLTLLEPDIRDAGLRSRVKAELRDAKAILTLFYGAEAAQQKVK